MVSYSLSDIKVVGIKEELTVLAVLSSRKSSVTLSVLKTTTIVVFISVRWMEKSNFVEGIENRKEKTRTDVHGSMEFR